ncbi:MAG TPA: hypothetical protein VFZ69_04395 [Longimicrobiales bacterium]
MAASTWGIVLVAAALIAVGLHVRRWRLGRITGLQFWAGMIARLGFVVLGLMYATGYVDRSRRAPIWGLAIVGIGIVLNLLAGILAGVRHGRS